MVTHVDLSAASPDSSSAYSDFNALYVNDKEKRPKGLLYFIVQFLLLIFNELLKHVEQFVESSDGGFQRCFACHVDSGFFQRVNWIAASA